MEPFFKNIARDAAATAPQTVRRLPDELADQIAAGEVVERPSSVIKELVENSLDAGATSIEIEIEEGGRSFIRIIDNGCGMTKEDARLAIQRHATSKITDIEDLFSIATLGFRGEAIPSIASVSKMEIKTKPHDAISGTRLVVHGGHIKIVEEVGTPAGTSIEVADLFYNTPARLKFLKTAATESRYISEIMIRVALSRPDVRIKVIRDGRVAFDFPVASSLKDRILQVLGRDVFDDMHQTFGYPAVRGVVCRGYFTQPSHRQRTSKNTYIFVNGRYVDDSMMRAAVKNAYGTLMERGKYPSVVLFVDVPFDLLDINVHPAKTEVRFHDTNAVYRAIFHAISDRLAESPWARFETPVGEDQVGDDSSQVTHVGVGLPTLNTLGGQPMGTGPSSYPASHTPNLTPNYQANSGAPRQIYPQRSQMSPQSYDQTAHDAYQTQRRFGDLAAPLLEPPRLLRGDLDPSDSANAYEDEEPEAYFTSLKYLGQFRRMYLLCEDRSGLVIIDQHAAHERVNFEKLRKHYGESNLETAPLLVPHVLELDLRRSDTLSEQLDFFQKAGWEVEPLDANHVAIKTVPAILLHAKHDQILIDILDDLAESGRTTRVDEVRNDLLSRMACHKSIRGPRPLSQPEAEALFQEMDQIDFAANCPHGRPVYFRISLTELEKSFDRI